MSSLRNEFIQRNNKLTENLTSSKSLEDLQDTLVSYQSLWNQITGLPAVCSRVAIDVSIACNVLITIVRAWLVSGGHYSAVLTEFDIDQFYTIVLSRVTNCKHDGHVVQDCPNYNKGFISCNMQRLNILNKLIKSLSNKINDVSDLQQFYSSMKMISDDDTESTQSVDEAYHTAYMFYEREEFVECLAYLRDCIQVCNEDSRCLKLLVGNCYYKICKPHCSLYYYSQCMDDPICASIAMSNSSIVFETIGNIEGEMEMRQLAIKAILNHSSSTLIHDRQNTCSKVYYNAKRSILVDNESGFDKDNDLIMAQYQLGRRALECGRYSITVDQFKAIINNDNHQLLPSSLPPLSILYLMLYTALKQSSNNNQLAQQEILDKLYTTLMTSSTNTSISPTEERHKYLLFCKVLWLKADRLIDCGQYTEARDCLVSCISFIDCIKEQTEDNLQEIKDMVINNLLYVNNQISSIT